MGFGDFDFLGKDLHALNDLCGTDKTAPEVDVFTKSQPEPPKFTRRWLMQHKKLVLVFGVQQTLLDQSRDKQALLSVDDPTIHCVKLVSDIRCFCKVRSDLIDCLHMLQEKFVIGIYTTGSKEFGTQILKILDPDSNLILAGCCEATTKFGERSLKKFAASLGDGDVELDTKLCFICDTDFSTWVIEDQQFMIPIEPYRYWNPPANSKADPMWPTTKLLLDLHELFFDKYNRQIPSQHLIRELSGQANGMTMLNSVCKSVKVQVKEKTSDSVTILIQSGSNQLEYKAKNELEAINEGSRNFLVQLTGAVGWKGLQPKVLVKQPAKKVEIRRMKELMEIQKSSNLYKSSLSPPLKPPSPLPLLPQKKLSFKELLERGDGSSSPEIETGMNTQHGTTLSPNSNSLFISPRINTRNDTISPQGTKSMTREISKILSLSAPPRGIHLPKKKVITPKMLAKKDQAASRNRPASAKTAPVATKSTRTNARVFNNRNKRPLENTTAPAVKRRKLVSNRNPSELLNYPTKEHLLHTADFGKGPRKILNTVGPKRYDNRGCIQAKNEPMKAREPEYRAKAVVKQSFPHSQNKRIPSSYDRSKQMPSKYGMKNNGGGIVKYTAPKPKAAQGTYPPNLKGPQSSFSSKANQATFQPNASGLKNAERSKIQMFMKKMGRPVGAANPAMQQANMSRISPLRKNANKRQNSDPIKRAEPAKRSNLKPSSLPKRKDKNSSLDQELFGGSISDDSDDEEDLDLGLHVIKRKKEAEKKAQLTSASVNSLPHRKPNANSKVSPTSQRKATQVNPLKRTNNRPKPTFNHANQQAVLQATPFETEQTPKIDAEAAEVDITKPEALPPETNTEVLWPPPKNQRKLYPDYPPSEYYTFQPTFGNVRCEFCQKPKPSPLLLICESCKSPPEKLESSFCIRCGKYKHPADFLSESDDICLSCSGMQTCKRCQCEGDARWFPKILWKREDKESYCYACLGNYVQCLICSHWRHRGTGAALKDLCICHV